ncbi:MAG: MoaD family protein [Planctomycetaceae bacterium]|jgi:adenylyltransferase/sulfurtransferase|nr:MoaD family protein [Planctomycetaceae bacterium]
MITIQLPSALRGFTGGQPEIELPSELVKTADNAVRTLAQQYPDLQRHLFDENDKLRSYVNIYLNDEDIRSFDGVNTAIKDGDTLMLIPAIAGGSES